jgi:hypothetical protein
MGLLGGFKIGRGFLDDFLIAFNGTWWTLLTGIDVLNWYCDPG